MTELTDNIRTNFCATCKEQADRIEDLTAENERLPEAFRDAADTVAVWAQQPVEATRQRNPIQQEQWTQLAEVIGEMFARAALGETQ